MAKHHKNTYVLGTLVSLKMKTSCTCKVPGAAEAFLFVRSVQSSKTRSVFKILKHAQSSHFMSSSCIDDALESSGNDDEAASDSAIAAFSKAGLKRGARLVNDKTNVGWFELCETWVKLKERQEGLTCRQFLDSHDSGPKFEFNRSTKQLFIYYLKKYRGGTLRPEKVKRLKTRKFLEVEEKLVRYIRLRSDRYEKDKCGLSWLGLRGKCLEWKNLEPSLRDEPFNCSAGWMSSMLKRNGLTKVKLHGEANSMTPQEEALIMVPWLEEFHDFLDCKNISPECVYNADQAGLFYRKLPNTLYVNKEEKKKLRGCKEMEDKTRLMLMVCTSATGEKCPLVAIGKSEKPVCFSISPPPFPYTH